MTENQNPGDAAAVLQRAQGAIYKGNFRQALEVATGVCGDDPDNVDALYIKAVCHRYLRDYEEALATLDHLHDIAPDFGRALQEEGHLFRAMGETEKALIGYQKACKSNPALEASWRAQADILRTAGFREQADEAVRQADRLKALPRELLAVTNYIHEGKIQKAEDICRAFLQRNPHHIEGMRLLADIGARFGVYQDADFLLESAVEFEPENIQLRLDYIQILRKRQKFEASLDQAKFLYNKDALNPLFQSHYAIESMQVGDHETAFKMFDRVLETLPDDPATLTSRGHALKTFGDHEAAVNSYRAAYESKPDHGDAYYSLANLKTYEFTDDEIGNMEEQVKSRDISYMSRVHFSFALGKAYEDRAEFKKSFEHYERGNDLKCVQTRYKADQMTTELQAQSAVCTRELFEKQSGKGDPSSDPIFILGLPRAGSTLLEQILASHSQVDGTLELPNILALSHRLRGRDRVTPAGKYPAILHDLDEKKLQELGKAYIDDTQIHRQGAPFFIDKMPNNFRHIGLIHLILPNAKIIDARRHPMDCCFSGFKQLFAEGQEFTYGLEVIGQYYRDYVELMDHWEEVLPGKILRVQYEEVVGDTEAQVRRMLDYLGLPFEEACVEFHKTKRSVRTASSEQVRQPINKKGLEQWRPYEKWLSPLKQALGPVLDRYPIV